MATITSTFDKDRRRGSADIRQGDIQAEIRVFGMTSGTYLVNLEYKQIAPNGELIALTPVRPMQFWRTMGTRYSFKNLNKLTELAAQVGEENLGNYLRSPEQAESFATESFEAIA